MKHRFPSMVRALGYRNYALFFSGQGLSIIGTWMQQLAMTWLVYRLTNSTTLLGVISFASMAPFFLFSPLAGVFADRHDRYRIIVLTNVLAMLQAFLAAFLTLAGLITVGQIFALSAFLGTLNSFEMPARHSLVIDIVERREDLSNAIALNSTIFNLARLLGPTLAGMTIALIGEAPCFFLNTLSFLPILYALHHIRPAEGDRRKSRLPIIQGIKDGWKYALQSPPIRTILTELSLISLVGMPYVVLIPVVAKQVLGGEASTFGFLMGALGLGSLAGSLFIASRERVRDLAQLIPSHFLLFGIGLALVALSERLVLSLPLMALTGFAMIVGWSSSNTVLQSVVDDDKRGRIMSLYTMSFMGTTPLGGLAAGLLADRYGAPTTLFGCGVICACASLILGPRLRSIEMSRSE
ncbi:MAG TPA: MFS transporter [Candidatus Ozemobacteraceae bacterium]|nr:MFS transporter [Candidatus Ozemobacteraceae bacterium]